MTDLYVAATPTRRKAELFLEQAQLTSRIDSAGTCAMADMACYPWLVPYEAHGPDLAGFSHPKHWFERMATRPAVLRTYQDVENAYAPTQALAEEERNILFGQGAQARAHLC